MTAPAERLASSTWRRQNSLWLAPSVLCCGFLTCGSFLYIGVRAKRRSWLIAAALYGVGAAIAIALTAIFDDGNEESRSSGENVGVWFLILLWIAGIAHGLMVNRQWLKWLATQGPETAWYLEGADNSLGPPAPPYPGPPTADELLRPTWTAPVPPPAPIRPAPPASAPAPPLRPPQPVDLNAASASDLESELGLPADQAARVVAIRHQHGGFASPDQLLTLAGIEPHIYASFRHRLITSSPKGRSDPPNRGRRLEL